MVFALLFSLVRRRTDLASDTVIGVFSSTAVALGIFLSTLGGRSFTKFNSLLVGDILSVSPGRIALLALILLAVVLLWVFALNQLTLSAIHPALADSRGVSLFAVEALFTCAVAVVVTLTMTWIGLLVINSMLILPGAMARNLRRKHAAVHPLFPAGRGDCRHRRTDGKLLYRRVHRREHHADAGHFLCRHVRIPEEALVNPINDMV